MDAQEDVVDPDGGLRDVFQPQSGPALAFHERLQAILPSSVLRQADSRYHALVLLVFLVVFFSGRS